MFHEGYHLEMECVYSKFFKIQILPEWQNIHIRVLVFHFRLHSNISFFFSKQSFVYKIVKWLCLLKLF
jgi:hypothetical protein